MRLDNATYFNKGTFNQTVYDELGLRTDNGLSTFQVQPRLQFTWDINDKHKDIIRAGAGIFAFPISTSNAMINNMVFDGTRTASLDITLDKTASNYQEMLNLIRPDFPSYRRGSVYSTGSRTFQ